MRAGTSGLAAAVLLVWAARIWPSWAPIAPRPGEPTDPNALVLMARELLVLGIGTIALGVLSAVLAALVLFRKTWAHWTALLGEAALALALAWVSIQLSAYRPYIAMLLGAVIACTSLPVLALLVTYVRRVDR